MRHNVDVAGRLLQRTVRLSSRTILEKHQFSPLNDLVKDKHTGVIALTDPSRSSVMVDAARIQILERDIINYFGSRDEDSRAQPVRPPVSSANQKTRRSGATHRTTERPPKFTGHASNTHFWTSGPSGTHVDHSYPFYEHCSCPGHQHHPGNHHCPCSTDCDIDQHENSHVTDDHHHHHHHHYHDTVGNEPSAHGASTNVDAYGPGSFY
jgi:hypothetical protein